jgi:hypothetical protein
MARVVLRNGHPAHKNDIERREKRRSFCAVELDMNKVILAASATLVLAACGTQMGDRMASGAAIGGGVGLAAGGVGAIPGAIVGAAVGGLTSPDQVNLGKPVWDEEEDSDADADTAIAPAAPQE